MDLQWLQPLSYLVAIGVFIWYLRKDSKEDYVRLEAKLEAWRLEAKDDMRRIEGLVSAIHEEMKDFHGRLCNLEGKIGGDKK